MSGSASAISGASGDNGGLSLRNAVITGNNAANGDLALAYSFGGNVIRGNTDDTLSKFSPGALH